jgi:hypothetical protein
VATLTTLLIVPVIYSLLRTAPVPVQSAESESPRSV